MIDPFKYNGPCIASGIPVKYLKYFKEVTKHKNAMNIRYRYRGNSGIKTNYLGKEVTAHKNAMNVRYRYRGKSKTMSNGYVYNRPQSFCHMQFADTFAIYTR